GVREEVVELFGNRAPARAERQGMSLGKRALALQARRHRHLEQLGELTKRLPGARVVHPLARVHDRPLGCPERLRDARHVAPIGAASPAASATRTSGLSAAGPCGMAKTPMRSPDAIRLTASAMWSPVRSWRTMIVLMSASAAASMMGLTG